MVFKALLLALLPCSQANAERSLLTHPYWDLPSATAPVSRALPGIGSGENLEYDIYWGAIKVGSSFIRVEHTVTISSRPAWHIISEARSGSFIANFYKVDDRNEAWMDAEDLSSYGYYKKISEGKHFFNEWAVFDVRGGRFYGTKMNRKRQVSDFEGPLDKPVNDVLSAVYRLRAMSLEPGARVEMDLNTKRNWRMSVKVGKREKISTAYGRKKCVLLEPMLGEEGLFVAKAGKRMLVWITDDELKLPMVLKAEIFIGSVTAKLVRRTVTP
ncbi:MAG TPA: hypothetical protein DCS63_10540 [Elusimicrobia bacterium]|nr:hypothetical protein [Elusimicrobiota bacterium]